MSAELEEIRAEAATQFEYAGFTEVGMKDFCRWFELAKGPFANAGCDISDMDVNSVMRLFAEWVKGSHDEVFNPPSFDGYAPMRGDVLELKNESYEYRVEFEYWADVPPTVFQAKVLEVKRGEFPPVGESLRLVGNFGEGGFRKVEGASA